MNLTYEEVLEYLGDRCGDPCTFGSHPVMGGDSSGPTLLGLRLPRMWLVDVVAVKVYEDQWLDGRAGTRIRLLDQDVDLREWAHPDLYDGGLVITREWFGAAMLDDGNSTLRLIVRANPDARPFYPAVGEEMNEEDEVFTHDLVGWGFTFDFDGASPTKEGTLVALTNAQTNAQTAGGA